MDSKRFVVAYSGGLDSTVLLDLLRRVLPHRCGASLLAVHVDHGLHPDSKKWSAHCRQVARNMGVGYVSDCVSVNTIDGISPEAAARKARYTALAQHIGADDVLLCAHHRDDQVETILLQLIRGAGVAGLAGMPELAPFTNGWCLRPLLPFSRRQLLAYADHYSLKWIDDPSNNDSRFDRNYLRNEILPRLHDRWPGVAESIIRSARHSATATHLLREIGTDDANRVSAQFNTIDLNLLLTLSSERQNNALRSWLQHAQLPTPSTAHLKQVQNLVQAKTAVGCVSWSGCEVRRYRNRLYAMTPLAVVPSDFERKLETDANLLLPAELGRLSFTESFAGCLDQKYCESPLRVRFRAGGEKIRPIGSAHRRELRTLFQEAGVVPWMRDRIPLLYAGDRLAAVANLWLEHELSADPGSRGLVPDWDNHPLLY